MVSKEKEVSSAEALSALEALNKIERETNTTIRPPLWLNLIISCFFGTMTFSWASTRHENLWMLGLIASTIGFLLAVAYYLHASRLLGVKLKLLPKSSSELKFHLISGVIFFAVFVISRVLSADWAPYIGGGINALLLVYLLHNFSTGSFIAKAGNNG